MNALEEIRNSLRKYPDAIVENGVSVITVKAKDASGFDVACSGNDAEITVCFAGWHEHFTNTEDAISWFAFGLSEKCRLKVLRSGRMDCRWTVEELLNGVWHKRSETGLFIYPFWFRKQERILQNHLLSVPIS